MLIRLLFVTSLIISSSTLAKDEIKKPEENKEIEESNKTNEDENINHGYQIDARKIHPSRFYDKAVIQALNKTTATTSNVEMFIGEKITFGQISIIARRCWQAPLSEKPESKILLEIFENKEIEDEIVEERIFYGWMFASSPSVSSLEHPIYDITALGCKN